jgi:hypothetical protein
MYLTILCSFKLFNIWTGLGLPSNIGDAFKNSVCFALHVFNFSTSIGLPSQITNVFSSSLIWPFKHVFRTSRNLIMSSAKFGFIAKRPETGFWIIVKLRTNHTGFFIPCIRHHRFYGLSSNLQFAPKQNQQMLCRHQKRKYHTDKDMFHMYSCQAICSHVCGFPYVGVSECFITILCISFVCFPSVSKI